MEEVENKAEAVSENVDEKSDTSVDDETEDERVSSLRQNTENEIKAESISAVQEGVLPEGKEEGVHNKNNTNADVHHVEKVHVATQQIEVQKVEHQTVENQHIVQMAPEHHGRRRVYLTLGLMFFCSFTGIVIDGYQLLHRLPSSFLWESAKSRKAAGGSASCSFKKGYGSDFERTRFSEGGFRFHTESTSAGRYAGKNKQGESEIGRYTKSICRIPAGEKRGIRNSRYTRRTSYEERGDFARFGIEVLRLERFYSLPGGV